MPNDNPVDQLPGHLVQLLFPIRRGKADQDRRRLSDLRAELTERFGGVTAYLRAPATGDWKADSDQVERDEIVIVEVMVEELEAEWWAALRKRLERELEQEELVIRALPLTRL